MLELLPETERFKGRSKFHRNASIDTMRKAAKLLRQAKLSVAQIGNQCGMSHYTICKWGKGDADNFNQTVGWSVSDINQYRSNYTKRRRGSSRVYNADTMNKAAKLFNERKFTNQEIAAMLDVSTTRITRWMSGEVELFNVVTGWRR